MPERAVLMKFLRDIPIRRKLMLITVLTTGLGLLVACGVVTAYELITVTSARMQRGSYQPPRR